MMSMEDPQVPVSAAAVTELFGGERVASGAHVSEKKVLGIPAVWRAVNVVAGSIAALPLHAFTSESTGRMQINDGPLATLLRTPHPDMTPFELWETVLGHTQLWGNAYLKILRNQLGEVTELWPIHPSRVRPGRATDGTKVYEIDRKGAVGDNVLLHIPGFGYDGVCGVAPVTAARQGFGLTIAAEEFGARFFGSGSLATGLLTTEQRLTPEQADNLQKRWKEKRGGLRNAHETIVLDSGSKFEQLTIPPEDAQFLQTRSFQISEIARMFGVPPHMLMDTEKSTSWGTGIESQAIGFVTYTLRPWLTRVEQRVSRVLNPPKPSAGKPYVYAKFSVEGLLRGDSAARAEFYSKLWNLGVLSTNDILALEERQPVEGGDVRYRPLNMGRLGEFDNAGGVPQVTPEMQARLIAELIQKIYLGVGTVLTADEAREIANQAGANLTAPFAAGGN